MAGTPGEALEFLEAEINSEQRSRSLQMQVAADAGRILSEYGGVVIVQTGVYGGTEGVYGGTKPYYVSQATLPVEVASMTGPTRHIGLRHSLDEHEDVIDLYMFDDTWELNLLAIKKAPAAVKIGTDTAWPKVRIPNVNNLKSDHIEATKTLLAHIEGSGQSIRFRGNFPRPSRLIRHTASIMDLTDVELKDLPIGLTRG